MKEGATIILGYAQFPIRSNLTGIPSGASTASTDGLFVWNRAFGRGNFNLSDRTQFRAYFKPMKPVTGWV
jgi:hypothetical protein